ncbi:hypothetical protein SDC9_66810 [bioreactor metagenome]|uniref:Uncharacterized protein n=1 Tax=bioreactor metagenome TaxID=1076179 RepID=A0A644XXI4_9ZZZZ
MRVVDVAHFKAGAVTRETAGAESREAALMGQLGQGVCLIHELRQRRGSEELLNGGDDRPDVDEGLRRDDLHVLGGHTLFDYALHAGKPNAELVLQKLTDRADTAVAEVVNVVHRADVVGEANKVVERGQNVFHGNVLGHKLSHFFRQKRLKRRSVLRLLQERDEHFVAHLFVEFNFIIVDSGILFGKPHRGEKVGQRNHAVGEDFNFKGLGFDMHRVNAGCRNLCSLLTGQQRVGRIKQLAGIRSNDVAGNLLAGNAGCEIELLVVLITADLGEVVPARIEEHAV